MGVLKLSPGCGCCGSCTYCTGGFSDTVDLVIPAPVATNTCTSCNDMAGTYTLSQITWDSVGGRFDSEFYADTGREYLSDNLFGGPNHDCGWEYKKTGTDDSCFNYPIYIAFFIHNNSTPAYFIIEIQDTDVPNEGSYTFNNSGDMDSYTPTDWGEGAGFNCNDNLIFVTNQGYSWTTFTGFPMSPPDVLGVGSKNHHTWPSCEWFSGSDWELNP